MRGLQGTAPTRRDGSGNGRLHVSRAQRTRMLHAAVDLVAEVGYWQLSVDRIVRRARVSRRTFYDLFADRDDCLGAAFDGALSEIANVVAPAYRAERRWHEQIRAALAALLDFLEREPSLGALALMEPSRVGPWVYARRAPALELLKVAVDRGRLAAKANHEPPPLAAEFVVGGVFGVLQTRISQEHGGRMYELLNPLMANIVLPYLGPAAARRELSAPAPRGRRRNGKAAALSVAARDPLAGLPMRLTYRTLRTLSALAEMPGASNRVVADAAGISDQGQISKLLTRLEGLALIENVAKGRPTGDRNAWRLTPRGEEVERAVRVP